MMVLRYEIFGIRITTQVLGYAMGKYMVGKSEMSQRII